MPRVFPECRWASQGRESLAELVELARSAGAEITGTIFQLRDAADPATLVGRGKLDEIRAEATARRAPLIIFDSELTPVQQRNIEEATERRVIDRTQLILDIFAKHARSREGQLQVELAQLNYMLPRLTGRGTQMSRLGGKSGGGGAGGAGGGAGRIGVRGPGEKKLETDRRRIRDRVRKIQDSIDEVRQQRALRREARNAVPLGTVSLVGYTNAGKSTLFNALSRAEVVVSPQNVRDAGSDHPGAAVAFEPPNFGFRHGGFHPRIAKRIADRVSRHAGRSAGIRIDPASERYFQSLP